MASATERLGLEADPVDVPDGPRVDDERNARGGRWAHTSDSSSSTRERFTTIGWGLVFVLVGALALPKGQVEFAAVAGVGALMLGLNAALIVTGHRPDLFSSALGATALVAGLGALAGVEIDVFALFFLLLGLAMIIVPLLWYADRRR